VTEEVPDNRIMMMAARVWTLCVLFASLCTCAAQHCNSDSNDCPSALEELEKASGCPPLVKPSDIHFMVINLDRSKGRLQRMREAFASSRLPEFERVPGVEVQQNLLGTAAYPVPRLSEYLKVTIARAPYLLSPISAHCSPPHSCPIISLDTMSSTSVFPPSSAQIADYGTCLAHYAAWKAVYAGAHRWVIILEDDADFVPGVNLLDFPKVCVCVCVCVCVDSLMGFLNILVKNNYSGKIWQN
jgi:hypothetical protein